MEADGKEMGGHFSHEYHFVSPIGEEKLQSCFSCGKSSKDTSDEQTNTDGPTCDKCLGGRQLEKKSGIEVNAIFFNLKQNNL